MSKDFESIQQDGNVQLNAVTTKLPSFGTIVESIFSEATDYTKKSLNDHFAFFDKLAGAKSFDSAFRIQSEYTKSSFDSFVAQATKMGELYSNLAKVTFKPFEGGDRSKLTPGL